MIPSDDLSDAIDGAYPHCPSCQEVLKLGAISARMLYLECTHCGMLVAVTEHD